MTSLENGMLVQHASLGVGKVVAVERDAVHVAFASRDARFATKLRLPMALAFLSPAATAWSSAPSGFDLDGKTGRYGRAADWISHSDAVARFTEAFPLAFEDPAYRSEERGRAGRAGAWRGAHHAFDQAFAGGRGVALLAQGDLPELARGAAEVERIVRTVDRAERISVDAHTDPAVARAFFAALFDVVAGAPERARFEALAAAVAALAPLASPEARWSAVTLLPFVARPDVHVLLRPRSTSDAAQRLGLALVPDADGEPGWAPYAALLDVSARLLERLRPLGARDHVDVEAFMHVATAKRARPKASAVPAAPPRARAKRGSEA